MLPKAQMWRLCEQRLPWMCWPAAACVKHAVTASVDFVYMRMQPRLPMQAYSTMGTNKYRCRAQASAADSILSPREHGLCRSAGQELAPGLDHFLLAVGPSLVCSTSGQCRARVPSGFRPFTFKVNSYTSLHYNMLSLAAEIIRSCCRVIQHALTKAHWAAQVGFLPSYKHVSSECCCAVQQPTLYVGHCHHCGPSR